LTPTVVHERKGRVNFLWGFLAVAFGAALVRGHFGMSGTGRLAVDVAFGGLVAVVLVAWIWFRRHPARLEITPDEVAFMHDEQPNATRLFRTGDLSIRTTHFGGTDRLHFLKVEGSEEAISIQMFDHEEVKRACRANGWRFAGDP
jgi:hypothetical protein